MQASVQTCVQTYVETFVQMHKNAHRHVYTRAHRHVHRQVPLHIHKFARMSIYVSVYIAVRTSIRHVSTYVCSRNIYVFDHRVAATSPARPARPPSAEARLLLGTAPVNTSCRQKCFLWSPGVSLQVVLWD